MIWVYAVCDRPDLPPPAPLEGIVEGDLLAAVTRHRHASGESALDALWAQERVVERLMAERAVLPLRFGTTLPDDPAVKRMLAERRETFVAALERVRGRVEIGLRATRTAPAPVVAAPVSGRDYLLRKLAAQEESAVLHEPLAALAVAARLRTPRAPDEVLRAAYLVERAAVPRVRSTVERLQRAYPDVALLCTGPWPPYSFMDAG